MVERAFFDALYRDSVGYVPAVTFPAHYRDKSNQVPWKDWKFEDFKWFAWPDEADELIAYCEAHKREDVSVSTSVCVSQSNRKDQIAEVNVIHCDADSADPALFAVPPNMVVRTSPKRTQLYWFLTKPVGVHEAEQLSKAVAYSQRDAGADVGWAVNKLMRVPGTTNTKPDYKRPRVKLERCVNGDASQYYKPKALSKAFATGAAAAAASTPTKAPLPSDLPPLPAALTKLPASSDLMRLFSQPPEHTDWNPNASRYKVLWKLGSSLFRLGLSREEVFVVLFHSKSNKYEQDGRAPEDLWRDVLKMEADDGNKQIIFVDEDPKTGEPISAEVDKLPDVFFLEAEERVYVRADTFIDRYREWGVTRTNADPRYHEINAVSIMSTVFSEFGYATPQYGDMNLEIWAMVLGVTTRSYKTTAAKMMLRTLANLFENGAGRAIDYLLPDDSTPESLQVELGNRGEISSLFHRDEAQAFIGDAQGGKSYMSGMIPLLTKLYDGKVPARSRITTGFIPETPTHLTINLLGVPEKMTQALSIEDFASGFLPRFLFVIGDPGPDDEEALWVGQSDAKVKRGEDPAMNKAIWLLKQALIYWRNQCVDKKTLAIEPKPITVDEEAWKRWNKFNYTISHFAKAQENSSALNAGAGRMAVTVHRLACLFAMAEERDEVNLSDMLTAISWAEKWFATLMRMIGMVSANRFAAQVLELVKFVQSKGTIPYTVAYRNFSNYKTKEFGELIDSAEQSGVLIFNRNTIPPSLEARETNYQPDQD